MIDIAVMGLVCADGHNYFAQSRIGSKLPVIDGNPWRWYVGVGAAVDPGEIFGIAVDRFLLEVPCYAMRGLGGYQV